MAIPCSVVCYAPYGTWDYVKTIQCPSLADARRCARGQRGYWGYRTRIKRRKRKAKP